MWISVSERISEIGLMRALGARPSHVHRLFLLEALLLTMIGGLAGMSVGLGGTALLRALLPGLPLQTPPEYLLAALAMSAITGVLSGVGPARRAARLAPVEALRAD